MDSKTSQPTPEQPTEDPQDVFDLLRSISTASLDWSIVLFVCWILASQEEVLCQKISI
jgi:hypothetical protein